MGNLEFEAYAKRSFSFLTTEEGYRCTLSGRDQIRFESKNVFIELAFDRNRSFELSLSIGEIGSRSAYSIAEILRLHRAPEAAKLSLVQVTTNEILASFLQQMAQALRTYGGSLVAGSKKSFAALAEQRKAEADAHAFQQDLRDARSKSEAAWRSKDYRAVVDALEPVRAFLKPSEKERLEIAAKKIGS